MGMIRNMLRKAITGIMDVPGQKRILSDPILDRGGWQTIIRESYPGAWQQNVEINYNTVLSNWAVWACINRISSDISKLGTKLIELDATGIWAETTNPAYSPVLRKPNHYQNDVQYWESYFLSKLMRGNVYVLKGRDDRGVVNALYPLDPARVRPLVGDDSAIFYELNTDNLSRLSNLTPINQRVIVPQREIIHDRMMPLFHPLVGTSPLYAAALPAANGLNIQQDSNSFFAAKSLPGGILTAPGHIDNETAERIKASWDERFSGTNKGNTAVLGDGLKFEQMTISAEDSQLIDQLKMSAEMICSAFGVPPYKIGVGPLPSYNNVQALNVEYYTQCLQRHIVDAERCLDDGLSLPLTIGVEFLTDNLLRMDTLSQTEAVRNGIGAGFLSPNEGRKRFDLRPVPGGDSPYLQEQNFSLEALAKRDAQADPFAKEAPAPSPPAAPAPAEDDPDTEDEKLLTFTDFKTLLIEGMSDARH